MTSKIRVDLKKKIDNSYDIQIGKSIFEFDENDFFVIDSNVYSLYKKILPKDKIYIFEASEEEKSFNSVIKILSFLKENKAIRSSVISAIGGGITGDITAFAASIYMRGIKCKQTPTTLLSMVDSSVGGKCGINFENTKNFIGSFWQPKSVLIDIDFLDTLEESEFYSGLAEVLKMAITFDRDFTYFLVENKERIINKEPEILIEIIKKSCEIKAKVVMEDEKESGLRRLLNFGHTFAHAIETDSNHSIKHGLAVAKGIYLETLFAAEQGYIDKEVVDEVLYILQIFNYDVKYNISYMDKFIDALSEDKKALSSGLVLSLTDRIGSGKIIEGIQIKDIFSFFDNLQ
jgi:3-dehydroquinate synthase